MCLVSWRTHLRHSNNQWEWLGDGFAFRNRSYIRFVLKCPYVWTSLRLQPFWYEESATPWTCTRRRRANIHHEPWMLAAGLKVAQDFKMKKRRRKKKKKSACVCVFVEGMGGGCSQAKPWLCVSTRDALEPRRVFVQILCIAANDYDSQICTDGCKSLRYSNVPCFFSPLHRMFQSVLFPLSALVLKEGRETKRSHTSQIKYNKG